MALIDEYSIEELSSIVKNSQTYREVLRKLGYSTESGNNNRTLKNRLLKYNISTEHFINENHRVIRNPKNIFIENSTASQKTLRDWYLKGSYTEYKCSICGQEPFWNGKEMTLILDHINGYNKDNRLENLRWVCPNCNIQLDTTNGKNRKTLKKKHYCIDCGKEIGQSSLRCYSCDGKRRSVPLEKMPITREELKQLIRTKPFTQIGIQFQISDNGIRKWCDKFNLPRTKTEINKYSDEEWQSI